MKKTRLFFASIITLVVLLLIATPVFAEDEDGGKVIFGGTYTLEEGETLPGDLVVIGGIATLDENSRVEGNIFLAGGTLTINGTVEGSVTATGGTITIGDEARIYGDLTFVAANVDIAEEARIEGDVIEGRDNIEISPQVFSPQVPVVDFFNAGSNFVISIFTGIIQAFVLAGLAALIVLLLQKSVQRVADTMFSQPAVSGGLGLLTFIVAIPMIILLAITIILIPIAVLAALVWAIAVFYGLIALGYEIGKRIAGLFKTTWPDAISAGIGTLVLSLMINLLDGIPCLGWIFWLVPASFSLGAVIISRFGTQAPTAKPGANNNLSELPKQFETEEPGFLNEVSEQPDDVESTDNNSTEQ